MFSYVPNSYPIIVYLSDIYIFMSGKYCYMVMRLNLDCNSCCKKARRAILNMKGIESHVIDKNEYTVSVYGRFRPADVAIKLRKKMNRRVQILHIQDIDFDNQQHQDPPPALAS